MQQPRSRVVRPERDGQVSPTRQERHVPPRRIVEVERVNARIDIVRVRALRQYDKVVAVKMNRVSGLHDQLVGIIREVLARDDEVDVTLRVVLWYDRVLWIKGLIFEI